jgi:hypothetical protein
MAVLVIHFGLRFARRETARTLESGFEFSFDKRSVGELCDPSSQNADKKVVTI